MVVDMVVASSPPPQWGRCFDHSSSWNAVSHHCHRNNDNEDGVTPPSRACAHDIVDAWRDDRIHDHDDEHDDVDDEKIQRDLFSFANDVSISLARLRKRVDNEGRGGGGGDREDDTRLRRQTSAPRGDIVVVVFVVVVVVVSSIYAVNNDAPTMSSSASTS